MGNSFDNEPVGEHLQLVLIILLMFLTVGELATGNGEELEELLLVSIWVHKLAMQAHTTVDGNLDFLPHWMSGMALQWTVLVTNSLYISMLELLDYFPQICHTLQCLDIQFTTC